jgi:hypothetical protein
MTKQPSKSGRYLLFLDVLGFADLVEKQSAEAVYAVVNEALSAFERWEELNRVFRTIYFSDTFIFYQEPKGYGDSWFLDVYAIGGMILSALLAREIPARGAITFGEFEVREDGSKRHQIYFGQALIEAYRSEKKENWIGITIQKSAWEPYERRKPGIIEAFEREGVWIRRSDDVLLLNPLIKLRAWHPNAVIGEVSKPYRDWNSPEFPNDIRALTFLQRQADAFALRGDFTGKVAAKYHATTGFLRRVLGQEAYTWGLQAYKDL